MPLISLNKFAGIRKFGQKFSSKRAIALSVSGLFSLSVSLPFAQPAFAKYKPGEFYVIHGRVSNNYKDMQTVVKEYGILEATAKELNSFNLALPTDVPITLTECGEANAYYDPSRQSITLCYEWLAVAGRLFIKNDPKMTPEELVQKIASILIFTTLHESGHALADLLKLPITGREEDAVDELAAILLLEMDSPATQIVVLNATHLFALLANQQDYKNIPFYDEHSLDGQRAYTFICFLYGKDPNTYEAFVRQGILPQQRAARCPSEYSQKRNTWIRLLQRHSV
jgi:Putative metallopeptidase